jgi:AcrR family transcriptional regulator
VARTRWGDRVARRQDILDAARRLLCRDGYRNLNIRDVARDADVSAGTVYTYFESKERLFAELYAMRLDEFHAEIAPASRAVSDPEELFILIATSYLDVYRVYGRELDLWSVLLREQHTPRAVAAPLAEAAERVIETLTTAIYRLVEEDGGWPPDSPDGGFVLPFLWANVHGLVDQFTGVRQHLHPFSWDELVGFTARTAIAGLRSWRTP